MLFWSPGELLIPLFCPWVPEPVFVPIAQVVQFSLFLILFFLLVLFPRKSIVDYLFRSALMSRSLRFSSWPSFFFTFFLKWAKSHSAGSKVLCCYSSFHSPSFWFLEVPSTCVVRGHSRFSSFLAGSLVPKKDISVLCFLCFFGFSFKLS